MSRCSRDHHPNVPAGRGRIERDALNQRHTARIVTDAPDPQPAAVCLELVPLTTFELLSTDFDPSLAKIFSFKGRAESMRAHCSAGERRCGCAARAFTK